VTAVERWHQPGDLEVRRALALFQQAPNLIKGSFEDPRTHQIDWGACELACATALDWNLSVISNVPRMPVIKGQVYPMAEVLRVLAIRAGWEIDVLEDSHEQCTIRLSKPGRTDKTFTMTAAEGRNAGSAPTNENWTKDPRAMLLARTTRRAIKLYCPEVLAGTPPDRIGGWSENPVTEPALVGEPGDVPPPPADRERGGLAVGDQPTRMVPPRSIDPTGATIPEALREPEVSDELRAELVDQLSVLDEDTLDRLRDTCRYLCLPNLNTHRFTRAHAALLVRLIEETHYSNVPTAPTPDDIYDDEPESTGAVDADQPHSYANPDEDDGRPV
jgi:hypothetical protein